MGEVVKVRTRGAATDRATIWVVTVGALVVGALVLISFVVTTVSVWSTGEVTFSVISDSPAPSAFFSRTDGIVAASISEIVVLSDALSTGVLVFFTLADALVALTGLIVALSLAITGWRLLQGDPFHPSVKVTGFIGVSALILGPFAAWLLSTSAVTRAMVELGGSHDELTWQTELNLTPVAVGIGLAIVLGAFEIGQRLKSDTEGLV